MTGAEKIINAMKKINKSGQPIQSQITSATVTSLNPLIFKVENRLSINKDFYELNSIVDWSTLQEGDIVKCFSFNEGQKYYINEIIKSDADSLEKQVADLTARVTILENIIGGM